MAVYIAVLLAVFTVVARIGADTSETSLQPGSCLCSTRASSVDVTDAGCGSNVIGSVESGQCFRYTGSKHSCSFNGFNYDSVLIDYYNTAGWVNGSQMTIGSPILRFPGPSLCQHKAANSDCPKIISRAEWGARKPRATRDIEQPIPRVFIHHTESKPCNSVANCSRTVRYIQDWCMDDKKWDDIAYNYLIGGDGNVYEGRGWNYIGSHVKLYNKVSLGIAMIGAFDRITPTPGALAAVDKLIKCAVSQGKLNSSYMLHGHRDGGCTTCPGDALYRLVRTWPHYYDHEIPGHC